MAEPYDSEATGQLAGTGAGRTARKADTGAVFHPASGPTTTNLPVEVLRLWHRGLQPSSIAPALGISWATVIAILRDANELVDRVEPPPKPRTCDNQDFACNYPDCSCDEMP